MVGGSNPSPPTISFSTLKERQMRNETIRKWLDIYGKEIQKVYKNGKDCYDCLYVQDPSSVARVTIVRSEKYYIEKGRLFQSRTISKVSSEILKCIKDVRENKLEKGNSIYFILLYQDLNVPGFGIWVVKQELPEKYEKLLKEGNISVFGLLM